MNGSIYLPSQRTALLAPSHDLVQPYRRTAASSAAQQHRALPAAIRQVLKCIGIPHRPDWLPGCQLQTPPRADRPQLLPEPHLPQCLPQLTSFVCHLGRTAAPTRQELGKSDFWLCSTTLAWSSTILVHETTDQFIEVCTCFRCKQKFIELPSSPACTHSPTRVLPQ